MKKPPADKNLSIRTVVCLNNKHTIALRNNISNPDSIQKLRGEGFVMVEGKKRKAELHWNEADEIDRFEFKVNRYLDES